MTDEKTDDFSFGPLSVLKSSVKNNTQVLISCRNNHKLLGRIKAFVFSLSSLTHFSSSFDRHCNMVLENVQETWTEMSNSSKKVINRDRFISKMFLRGDSVILVVKNPV